MNTAEISPPRALRNFAFSGACKVVTGLSGLLVSVMTARSLGAQEMGTYSFVIWVAGAIAGFSSFGLPDAVAKFVAEHKGTGDHALAIRIARKIVVTQLLAAGVVSVVGAGVWSLLARHHLELVFLAIATVMPSALQQVLLALLEGAQRFDLQLMATLSGSLFQLGIVALFAVKYASVQGFLVANLLSSAFLALFILALCGPFLGSFHSVRGHQDFPELSKRIFNFSVSIYMLSLLSMIVFDKSELFFLKIFQTPAELAYYSIAFGLTARMATAGDSISYVLFPMFVTRYTQNGSEGLCAAYRRSVHYVQLLMVPVFVWCIPIAPRFINFAYGSEYENVAPVVQVLLGTMLITFMLTVSASAVFALEKQRSFLRSMVVVAAINLILDVVLIPRYGALGAALANGCSQAIAVCGLIFLLQRLLPGSFPVLASLKIYIAAAASAVSVLYAGLVLHAGILVLCLSVAVAALVYVALLGGLGVVTRSEAVAFGSGLYARLSRKAG
jgi:O-antigen/teichoic acid export membrane protein